MRDTIESTHHERRQTRRRWLWFIGIYAASLLVFGVVVQLLRWLIL